MRSSRKRSRAESPPRPLPAPTLDTLGKVGDLGALAHYADAAYYTETYRYRRQDVAYYVRLARNSGGPVLEYGVGNGRIAIPMIRAGVDVVGVDLSRPMLDSLAARAAHEPPHVRARLRAVHGDMRTTRLDQRFPLVIAGFNTLLHLYERDDFEQLFARVREHLAPDGRFVFDFSVPQAADLAKNPSRSWPAQPFTHPETGQKIGYAERFEYDPVRQLLLVWMRFTPEGDDEPWTVPLTHRQLFPREVEALLHYNAFTDLVWSADFTDQPPDRGTDSMVVSCRLAVAGSRT